MKIDQTGKTLSDGEFAHLAHDYSWSERSHSHGFGWFEDARRFGCTWQFYRCSIQPFQEVFQI